MATIQIITTDQDDNSLTILVTEHGDHRRCTPDRWIHDVVEDAVHNGLTFARLNAELIRVGEFYGVPEVVPGRGALNEAGPFYRVADLDGGVAVYKNGELLEEMWG